MEHFIFPERELPHDIRREIEKTVAILLRPGASKIILYGALAHGDYQTVSDIDICVEGIPPA